MCLYTSNHIRKHLFTVRRPSYCTWSKQRKSYRPIRKTQVSRAITPREFLCKHLTHHESSPNALVLIIIAYQISKCIVRDLLIPESISLHVVCSKISQAHTIQWQRQMRKQNSFPVYKYSETWTAYTLPQTIELHLNLLGNFRYYYEM